MIQPWDSLLANVLPKIFCGQDQEESRMMTTPNPPRSGDNKAISKASVHKPSGPLQKDTTSLKRSRLSKSDKKYIEIATPVLAHGYQNHLMSCSYFKWPQVMNIIV